MGKRDRQRVRKTGKEEEGEKSWRRRRRREKRGVWLVLVSKQVQHTEGGGEEGRGRQG